MSYGCGRGWIRFICESGHYNYEAEDSCKELSEYTCRDCNHKPAWVKLVTEPPAEANGIPMKVLDLFKLSEERWETCNLGHVHLVEPAKYKIPTQKEIQDLLKYMLGKKWV